VSHKSGHIIISQVLQEKLKGMPEEIREKVEAILEKANKDIGAVLDD